MIEVINLSKKYPKVKNKFFDFKPAEYLTSINDLNFSIQEGEFVGFLGPNGAGKSTTIKVLSGILYPTSGKVKVLGNEPYYNRKRNAMNIGVIQGHRTQLWRDLPLKESYKFLRHIYGISKQSYEDVLGEFTVSLGLEKFWDTPVRNLSLGQRIRGELAAVMLHNPKILFLDEPTIGLDVNAKIKIQNYLQFLNKEFKTTIFLTTHNMDDVEKLCERVICINEGEKVFDGSAKDMVTEYGGKRILKIEVDSEIKKLDGLEGTYTNNLFEFSIENDREFINYIDKVKEEYNIVNIYIQEPNLENIMKNMYEQRY